MKTTNKSTVELIDSMSTDLTIVNAARVSFDKESEWEHECDGMCFSCTCSDPITLGQHLSKQDEKLINYLAKHNHWSPFAHTSIQLRVNAPIFVARQLVKHQVGGVWNEVSRRYVDDEPVFYFPDKWRKRAENVKQGSGEEHEDQELAYVKSGFVTDWAVKAYNVLNDAGFAPEQTRMLLPQNMMTSWYWTGSLMFFHRVYKQRTGPTAQLETQEVAHQIGEICSNLFPTSWRALCQS